MTQPLSPETGRAAMRALIKEKSPLGPLKVMAQHVGRFFQIPIPGFRPYVVFGPEFVRKVLVTEREKVTWRNTDPVTDYLDRGVLIVDGEEHDRYRALMEPPLHPARLAGYTQMMISQADRVTSQWQNGETVDMLVESRKIALAHHHADSIQQRCLGRSAAHLESDSQSHRIHLPRRLDHLAQHAALWISQTVESVG